MIRLPGGAWVEPLCVMLITPFPKCKIPYVRVSGIGIETLVDFDLPETAVAWAEKFAAECGAARRAME